MKKILQWMPYLIMSTIFWHEPVMAQLPEGVDDDSATGVVEAEKSALIESQVTGEVSQVLVHPGQIVQKGQLLIALTRDVAAHHTQADKAQLKAVEAEQNLAKKDYERQKQLLEKGYISQAAFDLVEARYNAENAKTKAQLADLNAALSVEQYYLIRAPFTGVVSEVPVSVGSMANPGHELVKVYDPKALRASITVPVDSLRTQWNAKGTLLILGPDTIPDSNYRYFEVLPEEQPISHTRLIRIGLPDTIQATPGAFARWNYSVPGMKSDMLWIPEVFVVHRAEMNGVYVVSPKHSAQFRLVRLGREQGGQVEVLSGILPQEQVIDPNEVSLSSEK